MQAAHLIVLIHGLYGDLHNLHEVKSELLAQAQDPKRISPSAGLDTSVPSRPQNGSDGKELLTVVYLPKNISGARTWDGIDVCAQRVAEEVEGEIDRLFDEGTDVVGFSVMGYSLGGLIARYLIGLLNARQPSFFVRHKPISFSTAATPHLGILKYDTKTNKIIHAIGKRLFSQTGRQLYCLDHEPEREGRSLLEIMADPDSIFIHALRLFPRVMLVANGTQDLTVPYPTALISSTDPFADPALIDIHVDDKHIVRSYRMVTAHTLQESELGGTTLTSSAIEKDIADDVEVTVTTITHRPVMDVGLAGKKKPFLPPVFFLPLPWPLNYSLLVFIPILLPFALLYLFIMFVVHFLQSQRRIREHRNKQAHQPLAMFPTDPLLSNPFPSLQSTPLSSALHMIDTATEDFEDGVSTPPILDSLWRDATSAPSLLLTSQQKLMVQQLNEAIPHAERVVAWFPWVYNSHAMLICRSVSRFPWQEDGRGVVKTWAKFVFESGEKVRHLSTDAVAHGKEQ
ncbi:hypothetical protein L204_102377 [Cryptococcus depauperatus]